jgi:hypothetical protein
MKKARYYLKQKAWAPVREEAGRAALFTVVSNLRRYHRLTAFYTVLLVKEHYNPRCFHADGSKAPWTEEEILQMYKAVGKRGIYPTLGVSDPKAIKKAKAKELRQAVRKFIRTHTEPGGSCNPTELRLAFQAATGGVEVSATAFGMAVSAVTGITSTSPFGKRKYRGFQLRSGSTVRRSAALQSFVTNRHFNLQMGENCSAFNLGVA